MKTLNEYINEQNNEQWINLKNTHKKKFGFMIYHKVNDCIQFETFADEKECESYYRVLPELEGISKKLFKLKVGDSITFDDTMYEDSIYTRIW